METLYLVQFEYCQKEVKKLSEDAKIAIRGFRRDKNEDVKKAEKAKEISEDDSKKHQEQIQKVTDKYVSEVDEIITKKEKELLEF